MSNFRTKRHRRTQKQVLKYGIKAKRAHRKISGRTGKIMSSRLKGLH